MISSRRKNFGIPLSLLLTFTLDVIFLVSAVPVYATDTSGDENGFESKSNLQQQGAQLQLEQLKVSQNKTNVVHENPPPAMSSGNNKGTLNLEFPAVSDNSLPQPESFSGGIDYDKVVSLSKVEPDKKKVTQSPEKSSTSLKIEIDYTPQDVAEYIFWTNDEAGVVSALNDFLQDDLVDKEDVIKFLEDVKLELKLLRNRYAVAGNPLPPANYKFSPDSSRGIPISEGGRSPREKRIVETDGLPELGTEEYDELVQKMDRLNMKLREDFLHDIIYRLAKKLFGGPDQRSMQEFTNFINGGNSGSQDEERNVLVAALVDFLSERNHLSKSRGGKNTPPSPQNIPMKH